MNHLFLRRSELISLVIALTLLAAIAVFSILDWTQYRQNRAEVLSSRQVLGDTDTLLLAMTEAESAERGFVLTGDQEYLPVYRTQVSAVRHQMDVLSMKATESGPLADRFGWFSARIRRLRGQVNEKLVALQEGIDLRKRNDVAGGIDLLRSSRGALLTAAIRQTANEVRSGLDSWVEERSVVVQANTDRTHLIMVASSIVLLVILVLGAMKINSEAERREQLIARLGREQRQTSEVRDLLKTTLSSIGDAVLVTDPEGRITYLNRVAESLTGWTEQQASGRLAHEVFRVADEVSGEPITTPLERILSSGGARGPSTSAILLTRGERQIPIDDSLARIETPDGEVLGAVLVFRDVTSRRAAERERERLLTEAQAARRDAERQRSHLHSLFLQAPASINIYRGPDHIFELLHPLARGYIGGVDVTGKPARDVVHDPSFVDLLDEVYASGEPRAIHEVSRIVSDEQGRKSERWFNYFCCPWREAGGVVAGVMTLAVDMTESVLLKHAMRETEERLRESAKLESLGVLAGGIAHDFNNLLVGIMGNASLVLEESVLAEPSRSMLQSVITASERAAILTRQMLAYAGKGQFVIEPVDLSEAVTQMLPLLKGVIPRQVTLQTQLTRGLPPIEADTAQLQQVFMNLVINAAEACGERPGCVVIRTTLEEIAPRPSGSFGLPAPEPGTFVVLEVTDTGAGMDHATRARVFDPFFTTKFTGRGLGLSAVLGIMRSHKGAIDVYSDPGQGSTFRVFFPACGPPVVKKTNERAELPAGAESGTVLLIDDEDLVRRMARATLEYHGYRVLEAEQGADGIEIFREHRGQIDLVLLDLTMPVMTGEQTLSHLRRVRGDVAVLLSSGFSRSEATRRFGAANLAGFLQKPYTAAQLAKAVRDAMETTRAT